MADHPHGAHLAHHFETPKQQFDSGKMGMWWFLSTEILMFGGLFCAYAIYRGNYPEVFEYAHQYLNPMWGMLNTIVLICSSFTMALAVHFAQRGMRKPLVVLLGLTVVFAAMFMVVKAVEYKEKWEHKLLWASKYDPSHAEEQAESAGGDHAVEAHDEGTGETPAEEPAPVIERALPSGGVLALEGTALPHPAPTPGGLAGPPPEIPEGEGHGDTPKKVYVFFSIYFIMTGLHGIHVLVGMALIIWLMFRAWNGAFGPSNFAAVDNVGLYWHLVDLIWIFLFPLLYLIH